MKPKTILHLCEHFGGADASLHGVARAFQWWIPLFDPDRYRVLLCSRKGKDRAFEEMRASGLEPHVLGFGKTDPRNLLALLRLLRKEKVDLIHAHGYGACMWGRIAGAVLRIPVIIHGRCNYGTVPLMQRPIEWVLGPFTKYALAVSESTRQFTIQKRHVPAQNVEVLYNGILLDRIPVADADWIETTRQEFGASSEDIVLGVVGRLEAHKGHCDVFEVLRRLQREDLKLWVVGDGAFSDALRAKVSELGLEKAVSFLGFRRDALEVIQCFDIQVYPSHQEGTPNTLFEGLAVGNPVVASRCDGQGEILEQGITAELYEPGDAAGLEHALIRLLNDPGLRRERGSAAKRRSVDFDGRRTVVTMEKLYDRILSN